MCAGAECRQRMRRAVPMCGGNAARSFCMRFRSALSDENSDRAVTDIIVTARSLVKSFLKKTAQIFLLCLAERRHGRQQRDIQSIFHGGFSCRGLFFSVYFSEIPLIRGLLFWRVDAVKRSAGIAVDDTDAEHFTVRHTAADKPIRADLSHIYILYDLRVLRYFVRRRRGRDT